MAYLTSTPTLPQPHPQPADATPWRCRHCGATIGTVVAGRLQLGAARALAGLFECQMCGHTRRWYPRDTE